MPPIYVKPENALKRSEELLALGTPQSQQQAFENLWEVFQSKRFKHTAINVLEPIMFKFIELCTTMNRKQHARLGLLTYKNAAQGSAVQSIETVLNKFIAGAEARLHAAIEQAQQEVAALPENPIIDDDLPLQPLTILMDSFIDSAGDRERIERRLITPAQKFCWDAYDISLDIAKGNDRLEVIYQSIAHRAFNFCKVHQRKTDFRRLCEQRLRKDLANATKYGHQQHAVNLADPETLARHLDTRFLQLETAVELELWQEAFRSVEDVHGLVAGRKMAKPSMMANYYEKLTQIFKAEGGKQTAVFHAAAWARYLQYAERAGNVPEKAPGCVLLSALAVPLGGIESKQRLVALLNLPKMPTRDALVADAAAKHLKRVSPDIRQIYTFLEKEFQPLTASKVLSPIITSLAPEYQPYLPALREVVLSRLVAELSQVYDTVSLEHILTLVKPFDNTPWATDMTSLEKFLISACQQGDVNASIDHVAKSITFTTPSTDLDRLSNLAVCLYNTMQFLQPTPAPSRAELFASAIAQAEEERKASIHRRQIVTKRRELLEEANLRREREESTAKAERAKALAEDTARIQKEQLRQAEKDRLQREIDATRRAEAKALHEQLVAKGGSKLNIDIDKIEDLDSSKLVALQVEQLAKEKKEMNERLRIVAKRVDHLERAFRKEERPLLVEDYERQKVEDRAAHEEGSRIRREEAVAQQKATVELKKRLERMLPDYLVVRSQVATQQEDEYQKARTAAQKMIEEEKRKFRESVISRRKAERDERERRRAEEEEQDRLDAERAEQEERAAKEEAQKEEQAKAEIEARKAEAAERAAAKQAEREAERKADLEKIRLQQQREEEAERRRAERASGGGGLRRTDSPATSSSGIRRTDSPAAGSAPPLKFAGAAGGGGGWRDRVKAQGQGTPTTGSPAPSANGSPAPAPAVPAEREASPAPRASTPADGAVPEKAVYKAGGGWRGRGGGAGAGAGGPTRGTPPGRGGAPSTREPSSRW